MEVEEAINIINKNWLFITKHELDDNNKQFKQAIETVLKDREILIEEKDTYKRIDNISNSITIEEFKKTLKEAEKEFISKDKIRKKMETYSNKLILDINRALNLEQSSKELKTMYKNLRIKLEGQLLASREIEELLKEE